METQKKSRRHPYAAGRWMPHDREHLAQWMLKIMAKADKEKGLDKEFEAVLTAYDAETKVVTLELENGEMVELNRKDLAAIRLAVIF